MNDTTLLSATLLLPISIELDRFTVELEFVQCLSNPAYLNFLAQEGYFEDESFIAFLEYLDGYWRRPEYAKFIIYPHCLKFLSLILESEQFRQELKRSDCTMYIHKQQYAHWLTYLNNRLKIEEK